jgi:hypothetical protein
MFSNKIPSVLDGEHPNIADSVMEMSNTFTCSLDS